MHDTKRLNCPVDHDAMVSVNTDLLVDRKVLIHGCAIGNLPPIHRPAAHQHQIIAFLTDEECVPPMNQGGVYLSLEYTKQEMELKITDKLKERIEEGCEMYPVADGVYPDERHVDGLMRTVLRFNQRLKALDNGVTLPRSKRIPHLKRGGFDGRRR